MTWRRLSPVSVVFYIVRYARFLLTDGLPALAPMVAVWATAEGTVRLLGMVGLGVLVIAGAGWATVSYLRFRFCLTGDQVLIRRGVLHREQLNVGYDRVQDVSIDLPFYARPFGMAVLKLDTAGSAKQEIMLAGIPLAEARAMRDQLVRRAAQARRLQSDPSAVEPESTSESDAETELLTRSGGDIFRYGLTANGLLWVAIFVGAVFSTMGEELWGEPARFLVTLFQLSGAATAAQNAVTSGSPLGIILVIGAALAVLALLPLLSVLGALWKYANYRLTVAGDTYHRYSGLVSRQEQTLRRGKVQAAVWRQNLIARWLKRVNLQLRMVSAGEAVSSQGASQHKPVFLVPAVDAAEAAAMTSEFLPGCQPSQARLSPIHRKRYVRRTLLLGWMPPLAGLTIGASVFLGWLALLVPLAGLPLALLCIHLRWRRYGYGIVGAFGYLRSGFLGTRSDLFPLFKVQRVDLTQSPAQRRASLAHLTVHLASHSITVPYVPLADAQRFANLALYHAESAQERWY